MGIFVNLGAFESSWQKKISVATKTQRRKEKKNNTVLWPNGSGTALQKPGYRFESGQHLEQILIY